MICKSCNRDFVKLSPEGLCSGCYMKQPDNMDMLWTLIYNVGKTACVIPLEKVQELFEEYSKGLTLGPILDPTAYIQNESKIQRNGIVLKAFLEYRKALEPFYQEDKNRD